MDLSEEFLENGWTTYALVDLDRGRDDATGEDAVARLDRITRIMSSGNHAALNAAQEMLGRWLGMKDSQAHHLCSSLRLRRVFVLKKLHDYETALKEANKLLKMDPDSPSLTCLVGNLHGWLNTRDEWITAISYFEKATELADNWWEPRLERLDKLFFLGRDDKKYWQKIADDTKKWLEHRSGGMTDRERLILWTYAAVSGVLLDINYMKTADYAQQQREARRIHLDPLQLEDWDMREIYSLIVEPHFSGDEPHYREARNELLELMVTSHSKLMPHKQWQVISSFAS